MGITGSSNKVKAKSNHQVYTLTPINRYSNQQFGLRFNIGRKYSQILSNNNPITINPIPFKRILTPIPVCHSINDYAYPLSLTPYRAPMLKDQLSLSTQLLPINKIPNEGYNILTPPTTKISSFQGQNFSFLNPPYVSSSPILITGSNNSLNLNQPEPLSINNYFNNSLILNVSPNSNMPTQESPFSLKSSPNLNISSRSTPFSLNTSQILQTTSYSNSEITQNINYISNKNQQLSHFIPYESKIISNSKVPLNTNQLLISNQNQISTIIGPNTYSNNNNQQIENSINIKQNYNNEMPIINQSTSNISNNFLFPSPQIASQGIYFNGNLQIKTGNEFSNMQLISSGNLLNQNSNASQFLPTFSALETSSFQNNRMTYNDSRNVIPLNSNFWDKPLTCKNLTPIKNSFKEINTIEKQQISMPNSPNAGTIYTQNNGMISPPLSKFSLINSSSLNNSFNQINSPISFQTSYKFPESNLNIKNNLISTILPEKSFNKNVSLESNIIKDPSIIAQTVKNYNFISSNNQIVSGTLVQKALFSDNISKPNINYIPTNVNNSRQVVNKISEESHKSECIRSSLPSIETCQPGMLNPLTNTSSLINHPILQKQSQNISTFSSKLAQITNEPGLCAKILSTTFVGNKNEQFSKCDPLASSSNVIAKFIQLENQKKNFVKTVKLPQIAPGLSSQIPQTDLLNDNSSLRMKQFDIYSKKGNTIINNEDRSSNLVNSSLIKNEKNNLISLCPSQSINNLYNSNNSMLNTKIFDPSRALIENKKEENLKLEINSGINNVRNILDIQIKDETKNIVSKSSIANIIDPKLDNKFHNKIKEYSKMLNLNQNDTKNLTTFSSMNNKINHNYFILKDQNVKLKNEEHVNIDLKKESKVKDQDQSIVQVYAKTILTCKNQGQTNKLNEFFPDLKCKTENSISENNDELNLIEQDEIKEEVLPMFGIKMKKSQTVRNLLEESPNYIKKKNCVDEFSVGYKKGLPSISLNNISKEKKFEINYTKQFHVAANNNLLSSNSFEQSKVESNKEKVGIKEKDLKDQYEKNLKLFEKKNLEHGIFQKSAHLESNYSKKNDNIQKNIISSHPNLTNNKFLQNTNFNNIKSTLTNQNLNENFGNTDKKFTQNAFASNRQNNLQFKNQIINDYYSLNKSYSVNYLMSNQLKSSQNVEQSPPESGFILNRNYSQSSLKNFTNKSTFNIMADKKDIPISKVSPQTMNRSYNQQNFSNINLKAQNNSVSLYQI